MRGPDNIPEAGGNPYVGPKAFQKADAWRFFGRDRETADLLARLRGWRLVLFYAQSGAGKSSLINAGLRPKLEELNFEVLPVGRVLGDPPPGVEVDNIFVYNLLGSLDQGQAKPEELATLRLSEFLLDLAATEDGRFIYVGNAQADAGPVAEGTAAENEEFELRPRVLIVDQLEELFTTHLEAFRRRDGFFRQLREAMDDDPQLYVLLSMREDYLARIFPYTHLLPGNLRTRYPMQRMKQAAAVEAVRRPAAAGAGGRDFAPGVARALVQNLQRVRVQTESGEEEWAEGEFVEPVQLQVVCYQLWQSLSQRHGREITREDLTEVARRALGKNARQEEAVEADPLALFTGQALAAYYEQSLAKVLAHPAMTVTESELRTWFTAQLITPAGTRNFLARGSERTAGLPEAAVKLLEEQHLLRGDTRAGGRWVELIHDSFIEPIQQANRAWEEQQPLIGLAQAWDEAGRPEGRMLLSEQQLAGIEEEEWQALGPLVAAYVAAGQEASRRAAEARERQRQELELEQARRLAAEAELRQQAEAERAREEKARRLVEERRATEAEAARARQRTLKWIAIVGGLVAVVAALLAYNARGEESVARSVAETRLVAEEQAKSTAVAAGTRVSSSAALAETRAAEARASEARAIANSALAESRRLVYPAEEFASQGNTTAAMLVGREAFNQSRGASLASLQDKYNSLWLALNAAADLLPQGNTFRQPVPLPPGRVPSAPLLLGPEPGTLAFVEGERLYWWSTVVSPTQTHTMTLPQAATHARFSADRALLVTAAGPELQVWQVQAEGELQPHGDLVLAPNREIQALALAPSGRELAVGSCRKLAADTPGGIDSKPEDPVTPSPQAAATVTATLPTLPNGSLAAEGSCAIRTALIGENGLDVGESTVVEAEEIVDLVYAGAEGASLLWLSPQAVNALETEPVPKLPPTEIERRYRAMAFIPEANVLVLGGCQGEGCQGEGFVRWWDLEAGVWLSAFPVPALPVIDRVLYRPDTGTVLALGAGDQGGAREWQARVGAWPLLACHLAGRNLTLAEWQATYPTRRESWREAYTKSCRQFGLDLSFARSLLTQCRRSGLEEARALYALSQRPLAADGRPVSFAGWALPVLLDEALLAGRGRVATCLTTAQELSPDFDADLFLVIKTSLTSTPASDPEEEWEVVSGLYDAQTALPETAQQALSSLFLTRSADLCAAGVVAACRRTRLAYGDTVQGKPQYAEWYFEGESGDFVTIDMISEDSDPLLRLLDEQGMEVAHDDDGGDGFNARLTLVLPESGDYRINAGWYGNRDPLPYTLSLENIPPHLLELPAAHMVAQAEANTLWQFQGRAGEFVTILVDPQGPDDPALRLLDPGGEAIASGEYWGSDPVRFGIQALLEADGRYLIDAGLQTDYMLSVEASPVTVLTSGPNRGSPQQRFWQFAGEEGDFVQLSMVPRNPARDRGPYLRLLLEGGELVEQADAGNADYAFLADVRLPYSGDYYVDAGWRGAADAYTLTLDHVPPEPIAIGQTLAAAGERQSWAFAGRAGEAVDVAMNATAGGDPYLRLLDVWGEEMLANDDGGDGFNARLQGVVLPATGTYYLDAGWIGPPGAYTLALSRAQPAPLPLGRPVPGRPEQGLWTLSVPETMPVTVALDHADPAREPAVMLYDGTGRLLPEGLVGEELLAAGQSYYLSVDWPTDTYSYTLFVDGLVPAHLEEGSILVEEQRWWRFAGQEGQFATLSLDRDGVGDPYLRLLDWRGLELAANDDSGGNLNALLSGIYLPETGNYYADVGWREPQAPYTLTLVLEAVTPDPGMSVGWMLRMVQSLARAGAIDTALSVMAAADALRPGTAGFTTYNNLCWFGAVWGQAERVLEYCDEAVSLAPDSSSAFDSRAVARALTGDEDGALADFRAYLDAGGGANLAWREYFAEELAAGRNPFLNGTERDMWLERLRNE